MEELVHSCTRTSWTSVSSSTVTECIAFLFMYFPTVCASKYVTRQDQAVGPSIRERMKKQALRGSVFNSRHLVFNPLEMIDSIKKHDVSQRSPSDYTSTLTKRCEAAVFLTTLYDTVPHAQQVNNLYLPQTTAAATEE